MENASKALIIAGAILISILLISIGIILINSGKDVTETGTAGMASQKIQTFNAQFTPYEGTKKGAELKGLKNLVNASNATDSQHQVILCKDSNIDEIKSNKNYTVSLVYSDGKNTVTPTGNVLAGPSGAAATEKGYIAKIMIK